MKKLVLVGLKRGADLKIAGVLILGFVLLLVYFGTHQNTPIFNNAIARSSVSNEVQLKLRAAHNAENQNNYKLAAELWGPLANEGISEAQYSLGYLYGNGQGVPKDYATAASWYRKAAEQGNAGAQLELAGYYDLGWGVPQDYAAAARWYGAAADQGLAIAQLNFGEIYYSGQGVTQDYVTAASWYRKAADQGLSRAQTNLGLLYEAGQGVPQDFVQAHKWYNIAAAGAAGANDLTTAVAFRDAVAVRMTPAQIAEAQKLAREWKPN